MLFLLLLVLTCGGKNHKNVWFRVGLILTVAILINCISKHLHYHDYYQELLLLQVLESGCTLTPTVSGRLVYKLCFQCNSDHW